MSIHPKTKPPVTLQEVYFALLKASRYPHWFEGKRWYKNRRTIEFDWDKFIEVFDSDKWNE